MPALGSTWDSFWRHSTITVWTSFPFSLACFFSLPFWLLGHFSLLLLVFNTKERPDRLLLWVLNGPLPLEKKKEEDDIYQAFLERGHYLGGTPVSEFMLVLFLPSVLSTWREILQNRRHARCSQESRMYVNSSFSSSDVRITDSGVFSAKLQ